MPKKTEERANATEEKIELKLTEWELDTICKAIAAVQFPGSHADVVYNLIVKLRKKLKEVENGNS